MPSQDLTGLKFGRLTVLQKDKKVKYQQYWLCKCDCGNQTVVRGSNLTTKVKPTQSCGCLNRERVKANIDLTSLIGKTYGYLTVLERDLTKPIGHGEGSWWICRCICGNIVSRTSYNLLNGRNQSCGCIKSKMTTERNFKDITEQKFGMLIAKEIIGKDNKGNFLWRCECDCGNQSYVTSATNLITGHIYSCGCNKKSLGETKIKNILTEAKINFISEFSFPDLKSDKNFLLRFDFAIFNNNQQLIRLIEFDGEQHYKTSSQFWSQELQENDIKKNNYTYIHKIPLVRIPYSELNHLSLDMIMGDKYLI